jgi:antitoxin component YwqK of YwqJK toxin-antitoxin module
MGLQQKFYSNSRKLKEQYNCVNRKREGLYESWDFTGTLSLRCNYVNGKKEGLYEEWHYGGRPKRRCNYVNGIMVDDIVL